MNLRPFTHRNASRAIFAAAVLTAPLTLGRDALAFCQTTTCEITEEVCPRNADGCNTTGAGLVWPDTCVTFAVEQHGSKLQGISFAQAENVVERAFQAWLSADCGGGKHPSIGIVPLGVSYCDKVEYNNPKQGAPDLPRAPNSNTVIFRDDAWPYAGDDSTLALTTVTYAKRTGEILDADIEINSFGVKLSVSDTDIKSDLQSILTHEVGHFLGLSHSMAKGASMNPEYRVNLMDTSFRTLSKDDEKGICSLYQPLAKDVSDCTGEGPRNGFSRYCESSSEEANAAWFCSMNQGPAPAHSWLFGSLSLLGLAVAIGARRGLKRPRA